MGALCYWLADHDFAFCVNLVFITFFFSFFFFQFGTDVENVVNLVSIPQFFDLEEYGQRRLGKVCKLLIERFRLFFYIYVSKLVTGFHDLIFSI